MFFKIILIYSPSIVAELIRGLHNVYINERNAVQSIQAWSDKQKDILESVVNKAKHAHDKQSNVLANCQDKLKKETKFNGRLKEVSNMLLFYYYSNR